MPREPRERLPHQPKANGKWQRIELALGSSRDVPLLYANKVIVNYTGTEFLVTVVSAFPEAWTGTPGSPPPKKVEGKVLARYAFSPPEWIAVVKSVNRQIDRLQAEGAFTVREIEETEELMREQE